MAINVTPGYVLGLRGQSYTFAVTGDVGTLLIAPINPLHGIVDVTNLNNVENASFQVTIPITCPLGMEINLVISDSEDPSVDITVTILVDEVGEFLNLTLDGSTNSDNSVFARQFIINENLYTVFKLSQVLQSAIQQIRVLSVTNQVTNIANLAAIIVQCERILGKLDDVGSKRKIVIR